jgi:hypothetical protein
VTLQQLLVEITQRLEGAAIPYMITGSLASSFHGQPRTTRDIDIVIDPSGASLRRFVTELPADRFYVEIDAAVEALNRQTQFNVIDVTTGWKVDLIVRKERPFSIKELSRRQRTEMLGTDVYVATAEDTILAKLEWARTGESERQLGDVAAILKIVGEHLDRAYIAQWADQLGVAELWERLSGADT